MHSGKTGTSSRKRAASGWKNGPGKSPKLRLHMKMKAEADVRKARESTCTADSISELFGKCPKS